MTEDGHIVINITIIVPNRIPKEIDAMAYDNVTLKTILHRYEEYGDIILQNGIEKPLDTVVKDRDILIIVTKRNKDRRN